jgi:hypothetical protein
MANIHTPLAHRVVLSAPGAEQKFKDLRFEFQIEISKFQCLYFRITPTTTP